jgi:predicted nucleic acid-binding protein
MINGYRVLRLESVGPRRRTPSWLSASGRIFTRRVSSTETLDVVKADPDDNRILECAVAAGSDVIVTGDAHLLQLGAYRGISIMKVADFLGQARDP